MGIHTKKNKKIRYTASITRAEKNALQVGLTFALGAALHLYSAHSEAMINVVNGSLHTVRTDQLGNSDRAPHLQRSFDSRSLYFGYFGLGWCSDLEYRILFEDNNIQFQKCDEMVATFTPEKGLRNLPQRVQGLNHRNSQGRELLWRSQHQAGVFLVNEKRGLAIYSNNQKQFVFDQDGRLLSLLKDDGLIELAYHKDKLVSLQAYGFTHLVQSAKTFHRILQIDLNSKNRSRRQSLSYSYDESGQLEQVRSGGHFESYRYDELGNLTSIVTPKGQVLQAEYDQSQDLLRKYVDENSCRFDITYSKSNNLVSGKSQRFIDRLCPNEKKKSFEIDIQSAQLPREKIYIQEIRLGTDKGRYSLQVDSGSGLLKNLSRLQGKGEL